MHGRLEIILQRIMSTNSQKNTERVHGMKYEIAEQNMRL